VGYWVVHHTIKKEHHFNQVLSYLKTSAVCVLTMDSWLLTPLTKTDYIFQMKNGALFLWGLLLCWNASATDLVFIEVTDPLSGESVMSARILSGGSYIYDW